MFSEWKLFYSPGDIFAVKGSPSLFRISPSQISPSLTTVWTSARDHPSLYRSGWYLIETNAKRRKRGREIAFILSFSSPRETHSSVNTTKRRHIVPPVMAAACLSRCSYSMADEIYRVSHRISSWPHGFLERRQIENSTQIWKKSFRLIHSNTAVYYIRNIYKNVKYDLFFLLSFSQRC